MRVGRDGLGTRAAYILEGQRTRVRTRANTGATRGKVAEAALGQGSTAREPRSNRVSINGGRSRCTRTGREVVERRADSDFLVAIARAANVAGCTPPPRQAAGEGEAQEAASATQILNTRYSTQPLDKVPRATHSCCTA
eukprot:4570172-Pleurochrysis_carterae.AAC.2